ncbi:MAG: response regulator [Zetaproteobacteria bacterium]|nr:response regulator [Zetaproteobacteria bacterium]
MHPPIKGKILVVEDSPVQAEMIRRMLINFGHRVIVAIDGEQAVNLARAEMPDLILLDIILPIMNGYAVIDQLQLSKITREIPVIFLTSMDTQEDEEKGLQHGAVDYVTKPVKPDILRARVQTHLELHEAHKHLEDENHFLEAEVDKRMKENELVQNVTIRALARLAEIRDNETGPHILRTSIYVKTLAQILRDSPKFKHQLNDHSIHVLAKSAPLHDIGKVGIPDAILRKPGRLTPLEWTIMRTHAQLGAHAIEQAEEDTETSLDFLTCSKEIAHWHHEKWDGSGYPDGLKWDEIPLSAQLMAVADVFDALISKRVYKPGFSYDETRSIMAAGAGGHFNPIIIQAFLDHYDQFVTIAEEHQEQQ